MTADEALTMIESDRWYGQSITREIATVLAAEVRRLQENTIPRCRFTREDYRCVYADDDYHPKEHRFV
jgi:hypothetical protein